MILEVADIRVDPSRLSDFEQAVHQGVASAIAPSRGFRGHELRHSIESPGRCLLLLRWDTLEDHTVGFRQSPAYAQWRSAVGGFFLQPPVVEHFTALSG